MSIFSIIFKRTTNIPIKEDKLNSERGFSMPPVKMNSLIHTSEEISTWNSNKNPSSRTIPEAHDICMKGFNTPKGGSFRHSTTSRTLHIYQQTLYMRIPQRISLSFSPHFPIFSIIFRCSSFFLFSHNHYCNTRDRL